VPVDDEELALAFYEAARAEVVQRLGLREQTLLAWIATVGVVVGLSAEHFDPKVIRLVPLLSFPFSLLVHRHELIVRYLGNYIHRELGSHLRQDQAWTPRHWDNASTLHKSIRRFLVIEVIAYKLTQIAVPAGCLWYLMSVQHFGWRDPWILAGLVSTGIVVLLGIDDAITAVNSRRM